MAVALSRPPLMRATPVVFKLDLQAGVQLLGRLHIGQKAEVPVALAAPDVVPNFCTSVNQGWFGWIDLSRCVAFTVL